MSYELANDQELLGQFASNAGYRDFVQYVSARKFPALRDLITEGWSDDPQAVRVELSLVAQHAPEDVRSIAVRLAELANSQSVLVITQGATDAQD